MAAAKTNAFEHLALINRSIREIYRCLGPAHVKSYRDDFILGDFGKDIDRDPIIATQRLAKRIAEHYRLPVTTVIVTFRGGLKSPGHVELSQANEFFVELEASRRFFPKAVAAILAHEVAHIFLHRCGIHFSVEFENEVLTDTTAAYLGFGATILNAATKIEEYPSRNIVRKNTNHFGYLTLDEFGYILAKRDSLFSRDSLALLEAGPSAAGFQSGSKRHKRELAVRPLINRPWYQSLFQRENASPDQLLKSIAFSCPYCSQTLRIPEIHKKLSVHCTTCDSRFFAYA